MTLLPIIFVKNVAEVNYFIYKKLSEYAVAE